MNSDFKIFFYLIGFNMVLVLFTGLYLVWKDGRKNKNGKEDT